VYGTAKITALSQILPGVTARDARRPRTGRGHPSRRHRSRNRTVRPWQRSWASQSEIV